jgi:hypothetical protein
MSHCSPNRQQKNGSCLNNDELIAIAKAYNKSIKICEPKLDFCFEPKVKINLCLKSKDLYNDISQKLNKLCKNEYCWTDLDFIKTIQNKDLRESIMYFVFKPKGTAKISDWLSTHNINEILQQYQELHSNDFKFLGAQPSDFNKIVKLNWKQLKLKKYIAVVFNVDPHNKSGRHWLAVFIDNKLKVVDYFDSLGHPPIKNIASFLKHFKNYKFNINRHAFQKGGSQCGVYSVNFIIERLNGKTFKDIIHTTLSDNKMIKLRKNLFKPN